MNYITQIATALRQAGIDPGGGIGVAVRRGWDWWEPIRPADDKSRTFDPHVAVGWATVKPDTDGGGIPRTPHQHLLGNAVLPKHALAVFEVDMDPRHLVAGFFRQCLIRPSDDGEPVGENTYLPTNVVRLCASSRYLMSLVGHPPRDLALWLDDLRRRDAKQFRSVLAKDFKSALVRDPDIIRDAWPSTVRRLWQADEGDRLPPFLVAVLYAELARTAMNQAGLLALSFDGTIELTTKQLLDRVGTHVGAGATHAAGKAIAHAPFQTLALGPPDALIGQANAAGIEAWARTAAARIALTTGIRGAIDIAPRTPEEAAFLRAGFEAHPQHQREGRKGKGFSFQPRKAATFWGLTHRENAAVRLLEIADTARAWNRLYRPDGPPLPDAKNYRSANPVAIALAAIRFRWVAEHDPASALTMLGEVMSKEDKAKDQFADWTAERVDPLMIDGYLGEKSGLTLLKDARDALSLLPRPGAIGYTARSQAHLWLDEDGDDLDRYRHYQGAALREHADAMAGKLPRKLGKQSGIPDEVVALVARSHNLADHHLGERLPSKRQPYPQESAMTANPEAARGAQLEAQQVSPFSTDPMWQRLLRGKKAT